MAFDTTNLTLYLPTDSITTQTGEGDRNKPYTYTEWLVRCGYNDTKIQGHALEYNKYVKQWNETKAHSRSTEPISTRYKDLLRNIALNYTTTEEKRFLGNLNYNNIRHVESALAFFSKKIKEISVYYAESREKIKQSGIRSRNPGSVKTIRQNIYNEVVRVADERGIIGGMLAKPVDMSKNKTVVTIDTLYEMSNTGEDYQIEFDSEIFRDIQQAVTNLLEECEPVLQLTDDISIAISGEIEPTAENVQLLDYENFIRYERESTDLNLYNEAKYIPKLIGTDVYSLSGGELTKLIEGEYTWRNTFNDFLPMISTRTTSELRSKRQLGNLYIPKNLGTLNYFSYNPKPVVDYDGDEEVLIADPHLKGTRGAVSHYEDVTWVKASAANDGLAGDIVAASKYPKFYSYRSDEEYKNSSGLGVSQSIDKLGFFEGYANEDWSNEDVFSREAANIYDIDERQKSLFVGDYTVTSWQTDLYGNQYALYKPAKPRSPDEKPDDGTEEEYKTNSSCQIIDGGQTLKGRPRLWEDGVSYKIHEGGRRWSYDPKIEQQKEITPFEDLRRYVTVVGENGVPIQQVEDHNAYNYEPNTGRTELVLKPITYHGFKVDGIEPIYDEQAYCGTFTDFTCGLIDPADRNCVIRDNYAFSTFSDRVTAVEYAVDVEKKPYTTAAWGASGVLISESEPREVETVVESGVFSKSSQYPDADLERDAFEFYYNSGYVDYVGFDDNLIENPSVSSVEVLVNEDIDGNYFASDICDPRDVDYEYQVDELAEYYDRVANVSRTKFATTPADDSVNSETIYDKQQADNGMIVFRSYNHYHTTTIDKIMAEFDLDQSDVFGADRKRFSEQVRGKRVMDMMVYYDVLMIRTKDYIYFERINFDTNESKILKSGKGSILTRVAGGQVSTDVCIKPLYNKNTNEIYYGHTKTIAVDNLRYVHPLLYRLDLNTMEQEQIFPNTSYNNTADLYLLTGDLDGFQVETISEPILSYNDTVDVYTLTYSCKLKNPEAGNICYGICVSDFEKSTLGYNMYDVNMFHSVPVQEDGTVYEERKDKRIDLTYNFNTDEIPMNNSLDAYYTADLNSVYKNKPYAGFELNLTIDTRSLPLPSNGNKINKMMFDPNDGTEIKQVTRMITTGEEDITVDITEIPDQSDFFDPRIQKFEHNYIFINGTTETYTPSLTAIYSNYKKLIIDMKLDVVPYTIETGFDDFKVIDSKTFTDPRGKNKQLVVIETDNPRRITHTLITKQRYSNSSVVGYLDGEQYTGDFHIMTDGTYMTGESHTPGSRVISMYP